MRHLKYFEQLLESEHQQHPDQEQRPHHQPKKKEEGIMSAADMMDMSFDTIDFTGDWKKLFGQPSPNFDMLVHGEPGAGKSTFLLKMSKYLAQTFGKVLYVSSEEFGAASLTQRLQELEIVSERLFFASDLSKPLDDYDFVIIDSVNDLGVTLSEFQKMRETYPLTAFVVVLQHTKSGDYRGGKDWEHEVEIGAEVIDGVIYVYRNRYGVKGILDIFEPISATKSDDESDSDEMPDIEQAREAARENRKKKKRNIRKNPHDGLTK